MDEECKDLIVDEKCKNLVLDERVKKLKSPKACETFAKNARERGEEDLAMQAVKRSVQLQAEAYGAGSEAEKEALKAVYAYEETLRVKNGKKTRASRTWQMIKRHGIVEAVNRAVTRPVETQGYKALLEMGLQEYAFEAVILRYPCVFSPEAVEISRQRVDSWKCK